MSRPPTSSSGYSGSSTPPPRATMAETQSAPLYQSPQFTDYNARKLPPLAIPGQASPRSDYHPSPPPQAPPSYHSHSHSHTHSHSLSAQNPPPPPPSSAPRSQPRSYSGQAAPLDKLLSPHPYTPPRSDSAYSPSSHSPPRSSVDLREGSRRGHERFASESHPRTAHHERYPSDVTTRSHPQEPPPYGSPVEPPRATFSNHGSPASSYTPTFPSTSHYRSASHPPVMGGPPHASYPPPLNYAEHVPPPPAQRPLVPAASVPVPPVMDQRSTLRYELKVRQQPIAARACGFGERDRRVIDPPPIIQLTVHDPKSGIVDLDELRYSLNVVHCTLWNADGTGEETALVQPDRRSTRRLMGQLVASPSVAKDEHDVEGCFFCFPDLSCRTHGKYRLRFVLMRIDPSNLHVGGYLPILTEVLSDVFQVYTAKDFPGMRPSSALTRALKLQGCNIQVKKGNEKALARKRLAQSSEEEGTEEAKKKKRLE